MKTKEKIVQYLNSNGDQMVALITNIEENAYTKGFRLSFRLYNTSEGIGGYETTLCVSNAPLSLAKMFCGSREEYKTAAEMIGAKILSAKTNNKVAVKFQFSQIKKLLI